MELVKLKEGEVVFDLVCGMGFVMFFFVDVVGLNGCVVVIDLLDCMIDIICIEIIRCGYI